MKKKKSHDVQALSEKIFELFMAQHKHVINSQTKDYGKDYLIELCHGEDVSGEQAMVQLKGTESATHVKSKNAVSYCLERKDAEYFSGNLSLPMFLVVFDVHAKIGYFLFMQQYLLEDDKIKGWRARNPKRKKDKSFVIHIPAENTITEADGATFRNAIASARQYMATRQPALIRPSIDAKEKQLESLDPRLEVQITATKDREHYRIIARKPVELTFQFSGPREEAKRKVEDVFGRGLPATFKPGELLVPGCPLLQELLKQGGTIEHKHKVDCTTTLVATDAADKELARIEEIPTVVQGGQLELRFHIENPDSPLILDMTHIPSGPNEELSLHFDWMRWLGRPIQNLAYFDKVAPFIECLRNGKRFRVICFFQGNPYLEALTEVSEVDIFCRFAKVISMVTHARQLAKQFKLNPIVPKEVNEAQLDRIEICYELLTKGEARRWLVCQQLHVIINEPDWHDIESRWITSEQSPISMPIDKGLIQCNLFGETITIGSGEQMLTYVTITEQEKAKLRAYIVEGKVGTVELDVMPRPKSEWIVRLQSDSRQIEQKSAVAASHSPTS